MVSACSRGSAIIDANNWRHPPWSFPQELVIMFRPWHLAHVPWTSSRPAPSGNEGSAPPRPWAPRAAATADANTAAIVMEDAALRILPPFVPPARADRNLTPPRP